MHIHWNQNLFFIIEPPRQKSNSMQLYSCCANLLANMHIKILTHWGFETHLYYTYIWPIIFPPKNGVYIAEICLKATTTKK